MATKYQEISEFLNKNFHRQDRAELIQSIMKEFDLKKANATSYYQSWRKEFKEKYAEPDETDADIQDALNYIFDEEVKEPAKKVDKEEAKELVAEFKNPGEEPNETAFENSPEQFEKAIKALGEEPSMSTLGILPEQIKEALKEIGEEPAPVEDKVNHPSHYTSGKYEVIDIIEDRLSGEAFKGYLEGNVIKYISRYRFKNGVEDLKKAAWYLNRLIAEEEE